MKISKMMDKLIAEKVRLYKKMNAAKGRTAKKPLQSKAAPRGAIFKSPGKIDGTPGSGLPVL